MTLTMTDDLARDLVFTGAQRLDESIPGWHERIDVNTLRIIDPCNCVLGQLYDSYMNGLQELGMTVAEAEQCGLQINDDDAERMASGEVITAYAKLTMAWKAAVSIRAAQTSANYALVA